PGREQELRDFLGSFRFTGAMVTQAVGTLSGGEKARLVLAMLVWQRPNLLLMDEPTNHLDLTTREALSMALNEFEGTVMLVSHDRALLREVCDEFWLVTDGEVKPFDGDLDDYQKWLLEQSREASRAQSRGDKAKRKAAATAAPAPRNEDPKPLRKELAGIDQRLAALNRDRSACEAALVVPGLSAPKRAEHGKRIKQLGDEIETLEARWLELSSQLDALTA
ncbi:MAG: ATP-binding cassette domain-containing protein, partial [Burkholderiales bacterium]